MFLIVKQMLNNLTYHPAGFAKLHPILCSLQFIVFMWDDLFVCFIFTGVQNAMERVLLGSQG